MPLSLMKGFVGLVCATVSTNVARSTIFFIFLMLYQNVKPAFSAAQPSPDCRCAPAISNVFGINGCDNSILLR